jgi:transglutaminase-like putative cysteine protease
MRIKIRHEIAQTFDPPAKEVIEALRLAPRSHEGQHVLEWRIDVEADCRLRRSEDAFGNLTDMFSLHAPAPRLRIVAEGLVETFDCAGLVRGALERFPPELYLRESPLAAPDAALRALAQEVAGADQIERLHNLMLRVRDRVAPADDDEGRALEPPASAAQALEAGRGDARELAHVFIAAARCLETPARFVSGYALAVGAPAGAARDCAHAWAEAHVAGVGWIGFDCVDGVCPQERHVRAACGLDWLDAAPVRAASRSALAQAARVELRPAGVARQNQQ